MSEEAKRMVSGGARLPKSLADDRKLLSDDRKSLSGSAQTTVPRKNFIIKSADMKEDMQKEAIDIAVSAFEKHNVEKDVAEYIKKEFDKKYGPTWHCIVGKNFVMNGCTDKESVEPGELLEMKLQNGNPEESACSYVTHETNHFVYFYLDSKAVLLFKSG